jgi:hypothetical protein
VIRRLSSVLLWTDCLCFTSNVRCLTRIIGVLSKQQLANHQVTSYSVSNPVLDVPGDNLFYPAWAFAVPTMVLSIPQAVIESGIWSIIVYWVWRIELFVHTQQCPAVLIAVDLIAMLTGCAAMSCSSWLTGFRQCVLILAPSLHQVAGLAPSAGRFFFFWLITFLMHQFAVSICACAEAHGVSRSSWYVHNVVLASV